MATSLQGSPASPGIAERAPVITTVPVFGSSVYRVLEVVKEPPIGGVVAVRESALVGSPATQRQLVGWKTPDDAIKPGRGQTTSAVGTSCMAPPSLPPVPSPALVDMCLGAACEMRLRELYELYSRREHRFPGPGEHHVSDLRCLKSRVSHRRPHSRSRDGPFPLERGDLSTRAREFDALNRRFGQGGCDVGPGQYDDAESKDSCLRSIHTGARIGSSCREATRRHVLTPSVSKMLAASAAHPGHGCSSSQVGPQSIQGEPGIPMLLPDRLETAGKPPMTVATVSIGSAPKVRNETDSWRQSPTQRGTVAADGRVRRSHRTGAANGSRKADCTWRHQQLPCPAALSAEAARCKQPGNWNWHTVARSLSHTFTRQDGGLHNNPRTKQAAEYVPGDLGGSAWHGHDRAGDAVLYGVDGGKATVRQYGAHVDAANTPDERDSGLESTVAPLLASRADVIGHQVASQAAAAAVEVDLRQKQWQLQSALLPLMKQGMIDQAYQTPRTLTG
eukprot:jgi/Ulvmu1/9124/UM005_0220.1